MQYPDDLVLHDESYLHVMHEHIDPFIHNHNHAHTVYTKPADAPPKFDFLAVLNYLSEFKSDIDKARARFNLGIPDEYSFNWGNLTGNIEELADLIALINSKTLNSLNWQNSVNSQYLNITSLLGVLSNRIEGKADQSIVDTLLGKINTVVTEVNKLWTDVANNSREITTLHKLITGDDLDISFVSEITDIKNLVLSLQTLVAGLPSASLYADVTNSLSSLSTRITTLENKEPEVLDLTSILNAIALLQTSIQTLLMVIGSNELVSISLNVTSESLLNLTPNASDIDITVTANYSKIDPVNITSECSVIISNTNVATWQSDNEDNGKIHIVGSGLTTLTFSFRGKSESLNIKVIGDLDEPSITLYQYVGYAADYSLIINNSNFQTSSIAKTWTPLNTPSITAPVMGFWIVTTQSLKSVTLGSFNYDINSLYIGQEVLNGVTYNVYMAGPVVDNSASFTITIN